MDDYQASIMDDVKEISETRTQRYGENQMEWTNNREKSRQLHNGNYFAHVIMGFNGTQH